MTPEQAVEIIRSVMLDPNIRGFTARQVLAVQEAFGVISNLIAKTKKSDDSLEN